MGLEQKTNLPAPPTVFISYSWEDKLTALAIDQWLRNRGARVLIDFREFIAGNDIEAEIVRCIQQAGNVICIYSKNSANRPYPELERRIAAALEKYDTNKTEQRRRLIYFCIDDTALPVEALPRLAIKAANMDFSTACEDLWRNILGKSSAPTELDLSEFNEKPPWKMDKKEQEDVAKAAWDAMRSIFDSQTSGSTLSKWKREVFEELLENVESLPEDRRLPRIISRLREMVEKDGQWEKNAQESESKYKTHFEEAEIETDELGAKAARILGSAILSGVMKDSRTLHRIRRELLDDMKAFEKEGRSYKQLVKHLENVLLS